MLCICNVSHLADIHKYNIVNTMESIENKRLKASKQFLFPTLQQQLPGKVAGNTYYITFFILGKLECPTISIKKQYTTFGPFYKPMPEIRDLPQQMRPPAPRPRHRVGSPLVTCASWAVNNLHRTARSADCSRPAQRDK